MALPAAASGRKSAAGREGAGRLVMVLAGENHNLFIVYLINETICLRNPSRPAASELTLQWLRLAKPRKWLPCNIFKKANDLPMNFWIELGPFVELREGSRRKGKIPHRAVDRKSSSVTLTISPPFSTCRISCSRNFACAGLSNG